MSNWLDNGEWNSGQPQQGLQGSWRQGQQRGRGEWQAMQQAPPISAFQQPQFSGQGQGQSLSGPGPQGYSGGGGQYGRFQGFHGSAGQSGPPQGGYPQQRGPLHAAYPQQGIPQGPVGVSGQPATPQSGYPQQTMPPQGGYPQQQMSQQEIQRRHEQELERRAREEQKRRELEIQRRKMKNINISSPATGDLESLVALPVPRRTGSFGSKSSPPIGRSTVAEETSEPSSGNPPSQGNGTLKTEQPVAGSDVINPEKEQASLEKLVESSLSNLTDAPTKKGAPFKFQQPSIPTSRSAATKTYSPSTKARAWTAGTAALEGVFAQHSQSGQHQQEEFGEFHSGPSYPSDGVPGAGQGVVGSEQGGFRVSGQGPVQSIPLSGQVNTSQPPAAKLSGLDAAKFPAVYAEVYRRCALNGEDHVSTELLFPILLSSSLPSRALRDLWTQANRSVPGKLNQTELFVLLGLIGLVQSGNAHPTMADLKQAPHPPIPVLSAVQVSQSPSPAIHKTNDFGDFQQGRATLHTPSPPQARVPPNPSPLQPDSTHSNTDKTSPPDLTSAFPLADYKPPTDDKYGAFSDLTSQTSAPHTVSNPTTSGSGLAPIDNHTPHPNEKYSAFSNPKAQAPAPLADFNTATSKAAPPGDKYSVFSTLNAHAIPKVSDTLVPGAPPSTASSGFGDFASFQAQPTSLAGTQTSWGGFPANPASTSLSTGAGKAGTGFSADDDFGSFTSNPPPPLFGPSVAPPPSVSPEPSLAPPSSIPLGTSVTPASTGEHQTEGWADFAHVGVIPPPIPPVQAVAPPPSLDAMAQPNTGTTAFDDILPMEFAVGKLKQKDEGLPIVDDVLSKPSQPKLTKSLTLGLEILDKEMSSRLTGSTQPAAYLIPEPASAAGAPTAVSSTSSLENFGDFESYPEAITGAESPPDPCLVWCCCLEKCLEVLSSCAAVFSSVEDPAVLKEIVQSEEGTNRLKCIAEIYRLARRIYYSIKERRQEGDCKAAVDGISREWLTLTHTLPGDILEHLYEESHPTQTEEAAVEGDFLSDSISRCSLCLVGKVVSIPASFSLTGSPETYPLSLLFHEGQMYHPTCANFWINVVQEKLPDLSE